MGIRGATITFMSEAAFPVLVSLLYGRRTQAPASTAVMMSLSIGDSVTAPRLDSVSCLH
jgi:hypothetical protein